MPVKAARPQRSGGKPGFQGFQEVKGDAVGVPQVAAILFQKHLALIIQHHQVEAHRANVHPQIESVHHMRNPRRRELFSVTCYLFSVSARPLMFCLKKTEKCGKMAYHPGITS